jgi:hypothetical protein
MFRLCGCSLATPGVTVGPRVLFGALPGCRRGGLGSLGGVPGSLRGDLGRLLALCGALGVSPWGLFGFSRGSRASLGRSPGALLALSGALRRSPGALWRSPALSWRSLAPLRGPAARLAQIVDFDPVATPAALGPGFRDSGAPPRPCGQTRSDR